MQIIFEGKDGILARLIGVDEFVDNITGTDEEKMIHLANKDLDTGTKYEIVADDYVLSDRTFRNAWEYVAGGAEKTSADLSLDYQLKYNKITQQEYDDAQ